MDTSSGNEASERLFLNKSNCNTIFQIPSHLVKSYGPVLPSRATLRVDESGKKWRVSVEKFRDHYFFTDGWKEFAEEVDLKSLDFLTFKSRSSAILKGTDKGKTREASGSVNVNQDKVSRVETTLSFNKQMKKYNQYTLDIPRDIVSQLGLCKDVKITLRNREGREWPVTLRRRNNTLSMMKGWGDFVIDNKVMLESTISFTWLSGETLQAEIVEAGIHNQPLFNRKNYRKQRLQDHRV